MRKNRVSGLVAMAFGLSLLAVGGTAAPAALAFGPPPDDLSDLSVSQTNSGNWAADPGDATSYSLTIKNPSIQVWDPELHRYYTGGATAYGVVVRDTLPNGSQFVSATGDSGFSCSQAGGVVTCSGGTLLNGASGHITINTHAPSATGLYTNAVAVDPNNTIAERSEANNTASASISVIYWY
jgi:uncharacterized protein DUF11